MKTLLNLLNLAILVMFCLALGTGMFLGGNIPGMGAHLGWILGALLLWIFASILAMLYMYRMEKFCVEIVEKFEKPGETKSEKVPS